MDFSYVTTTSSADWRSWAGRNVEVTDGAISLSTSRMIEQASLGLDAIDIAVDRDENVYALRPSGDLYWHDQDSELTKSLWANDEGEVIYDPRAIGIAGDSLFVADRNSGDIVVVSVRSESIAGRIDAGLRNPTDVVTREEKVYVLDAGTDGETDGRVLTIRRGGEVETVLGGLASPSEFTIDDSGTLYVLEGDDAGGATSISVYDASYVASADSLPFERRIDELVVDDTETRVIPTSIEAVGDRELLVHGYDRDSGQAALFRYRLGRADAGEDGLGATPAVGDGTGDPGVGTDAGVGTDRPGGDGDGEDSFERRYGLDAPCSRLLTGYHRDSNRYPMYYAVAGTDRDVIAIDETRRYDRNSGTDRYTAEAFRRIDGGQDYLQWHRMTMSFDRTSSNTQVLVSYYATDENRQNPAGVAVVEGIDEDAAAALNRAGVDSVWDLLEADADRVAGAVETADRERVEEWRAAAVDVLDGAWADRWRPVDDPNPEDALFEGAEGRYLHVRVELVGSVDASPLVGQFRAYCPRKTYLRYLPDIYQEEAGGSSFFARYLAAFESAFVDIEEDLETVSRYFDPYGIPEGYLPWLESWLAAETGESWPEPARREFLARAADLYRKRGTRRGLRDTLRLYLGHVQAPDTSWTVRWERARLRRRVEEGHATEADIADRVADLEATVEGPDARHLLFFFEREDLTGVADPARRPYTAQMRGPRSFLVFAGPFIDREHQRAVEEIVARQKPAHTDATVVEVRQQFKLKGNTFLGINSTLTGRNFTVGRSTLGGDTVLGSRGPLSSP